MLQLFEVLYLLSQSIHIRFFQTILFYHHKTYFIIYTIPFYITQHPNFYFPILLIKIIYPPNKIYFFLFFFPNFLLPRVYIFKNFLYFSPSSKLLHTGLHYSQAHKLPQPLAPHLHCPVTTTAPPPCPPRHHYPSKSHWKKNPNTTNQP